MSWNYSVDAFDTDSCSEIHQVIAECVEGANFLGLNGFTLYFDQEPSNLPTILDVIENYVTGSIRVTLYDYIPEHLCHNPLTPPYDIDFSTASDIELHKLKTDIWQGDIREIIYYAEYDPVTGQHSIPIVRRTYDITYWATSIQVLERLYWYRRNGSTHPDYKELTRYYTGQRWLDWLEAKRKQIIDWLRYHVAAAIIYHLPHNGMDSISDVMLEGSNFFGEHANAISAFIGGNSQNFPQAVLVDTRTWLALEWPGRSGDLAPTISLVLSPGETIAQARRNEHDQ